VQCVSEDSALGRQATVIFLLLGTSTITTNKQTNKQQTPWSESASELYRPSDRRLSAKLVPTFADRGCHVVSVTDPYGRILDFLDRSRYFFCQVAQLYSRGWMDPVPDPLLVRKSGSAGNPDLWICSQELWLLDHRGGPSTVTVDRISADTSPFEGPVVLLQVRAAVPLFWSRPQLLYGVRIAPLALQMTRGGLAKYPWSILGWSLFRNCGTGFSYGWYLLMHMEHVSLADSVFVPIAAPNSNFFCLFMRVFSLSPTTSFFISSFLSVWWNPYTVQLRGHTSIIWLSAMLYRGTR
jgi:hypothetical protein